MNNKVHCLVKVLAVLFLVVVAFALTTRSPAKRSANGTNTVGVKIETVDPTTGVMTTERGSVTTEPSADTSGSRRITFTVRPQLGNGTNSK